MLSYTQLRNLYGNLTNDSTSDNLTLGDTLMNECIRQICAKWQWDFIEKTETINTVASQQSYNLPHDYLKTTTLYLTVGSTQYTPEECPNKKFWDILNSPAGQESDIPQYYMIFAGKLWLWPVPSTSSLVITLTYRRNVPDLNVADYSTGNVSAVTNGAKTVTGSGTTWTAPMAGRHLRITKSDTAANAGDHIWYEIASVASATSLSLLKDYEGTTLAAATASYIIGQMPVLPEQFHMLPVYYAANVYFMTKNLDNGRAQQFKEMYDELFDAMKAAHGRKTNNVVVLDGPANPINPNLAPMDVS